MVDNFFVSVYVAGGPWRQKIHLAGGDSWYTSSVLLCSPKLWWIGLKLPLLVHDEIKEVYKEHLSAPVWNYTTKNLNDTQSFVDAFGAMVEELPDYLVGLSAIDI